MWSFFVLSVSIELFLVFSERLWISLVGAEIELHKLCSSWKGGRRMHCFDFVALWLFSSHFDIGLSEEISNLLNCHSRRRRTRSGQIDKILSPFVGSPALFFVHFISFVFHILTASFFYFIHSFSDRPRSGQFGCPTITTSVNLNLN